MEEQVFIPIEKFCKICREQCNKKCSGCDAVYYCSSEHQLQDWPRHKSECNILKQGKKVTIQPEPIITREDGSTPNISEKEKKDLIKTAKDSLMDFAFHYIDQCENGIIDMHKRGKRCFISIEMTSGEGPVESFPYVGKYTIETDAKKFAKIMRDKSIIKYMREYIKQREICVVIWNKDGSFSQTWQIVQPWILKYTSMVNAIKEINNKSM